MPRTIRGRLVVWCAILLISCLAGFGVLMFQALQAAERSRFDAQLLAKAQMLAAKLPRHGPRRPDFRRPGRPGGGFMRRERPDENDQLPIHDRVLASFSTGEPDSYYFVIYRNNDEVWQASDEVLEDLSAPVAADRPLRSPDSQSTFRTRGDLREVLVSTLRGHLVLVGRSMALQKQASTEFAWMLLIAGTAVLAVAILGVWWLTGRALRPIVAMANVAEGISATNLSERIDDRNAPTELARLSAVLNSAFDRLERAIEQEKLFTANVSHELRTPLCVMIAQSELALSRPRDSEDYQHALRSCYNAAVRMNQMVDAMLTLAQMENGQTPNARVSLDLAESIKTQTALLQTDAQDKNVTLETEVEPVKIRGNEQLIDQLIFNLLSNAIRYNRPGGSVRCSAKTQNGSVKVDVTDTGIGIDPAEQQRVFERFYRVDKARSRADGGCGLGLSLCRSIVDIHHGEIQLASDHGEGTTVSVSLPRENGAGETTR